MSDIFNLCILRNFVKENFGDKFPTELIHLIMMLQYDPIIINGNDSSNFIIKQKKIYACGRNYGFRLNVIDKVCHFENIPTENIKYISNRYGDTHIAILTKNNDIYIYSMIPPQKKMSYNIPNYLINTIVCSKFYTLALTNCGKIFSHDISWDGIIPDNFTQIISIKSAISISCGHSHGIALMKNNKLVSWKYNEFEQLQSIDLENIISVECGSLFTIALDKYRSLYAWGADIFLGLSYKNPKKYYETPQKIYSNISQISCGHNHIVALSNMGDAYVWGSNANN